ncbi:substrate-binding domain-containing protein [Microcoleus sp. A006_D1]|uniref:substrate-binding domain-containing protein n=1 Tax=Microcoleus sp. A006_D1 TaxID=3055267 RepID=UPI002FD6FFBA
MLSIAIGITKTQIYWRSWSAIAAVLLLTACALHSVTQKEKIVNQVSPVSADNSSKKNLGIQRVDRKLVKPPSGPDPATQGIVLPALKPLEMEGSIAISGSQVILPLSQAIAQRYIENGYPSKIDLAGIDTQVGFKLFCDRKKVDIVNAVRPISSQEAQACAKSGVEPIGFQIATDAVTIVVSSQNNFLPTNLTREQLAKIFTFEKWYDVNPKWPSEVIKRIVPAGAGTGGAVDLVVKAILKGDCKQFLNSPYTVFYDFVEQLHSEALTNPYMVGFLEYASYKQNQDQLKAIAIDGVVASSPQYPITRPLYIYADAKAIRTRPEIEGFINYYLTNVREESQNLGYLPVKQQVLEDSKAKFLQVQGNKGLSLEPSNNN